MYPKFENVTRQPGCCITDGGGTVTSAYGLNNTCHLLLYMGEAAPYRLTLLDNNTGNLSLSTGQCISLTMKIQNDGTYSTGDGMGPSDAGLASKYGYNGCVVGVSTPFSFGSIECDRRKGGAGEWEQVHKEGGVLTVSIGF